MNESRINHSFRLKNNNGKLVRQSCQLQKAIQWTLFVSDFRNNEDSKLSCDYEGVFPGKITARVEWKVAVVLTALPGTVRLLYHHGQ